jgi:spore coat protein U-like protein
MRSPLRLLAALMVFAAPIARGAEANRCVVSVTPVHFGIYNPLSASDIRTTGVVTYNCTQSRPISISLTRGDSTYDNRSMGQGLNTLAYNLYLDAAGTLIWGDGSDGSQVYRDAAPPPDTNVSVPIYGRVPSRQRQVHVGAVDDSLLVTINY